MCQTVDFTEAKAKHLAWKQTIRECLDGKTQMDPQKIVSHEHCDLGKWYYAEGKDLYGTLQPMHIFEIKHIKLHKIIKDVCMFKDMGDEEMAEELYEDLCATSDKIVQLLTQAEQLINK